MQLLNDNLIKAHDRMKMVDKKKRTEREFAEGDWMYLRLQPYMQISVSGRRPQKLLMVLVMIVALMVVAFLGAWRL